MNALFLAMILAQPLPTPPGADPLPPGTVEQVQPPKQIEQPTAKEMHRRVTLKDGWTYRFDATWSEADIREWVARKEGSRAARPFSVDEPQATADGDAKLPVGKMPPQGEKYVRAKYTQEIAVTNGRDRITPVNRFRLASWTHQSGGMEGVLGWRSEAFRRVPKEASPYIANLGVLNSFGYIQYNRGWARSYPDGTRFDDVLTNTKSGKIFEHRVAFKAKGEWTRRVIFSDHAQRPAGYTGLKQSCSSCHDQAGTGGYATGLVPGADTIISDPFPALESE